MESTDQDTLLEVSSLTPKQLLEKEKDGNLITGGNLAIEDQALVIRIAGKIDLNNPAYLMTYGTDTQAKMSEFSDRNLTQYSMKELGETSRILTSLVDCLRGYDSNKNSTSGNPFKRFFQNRRLKEKERLQIAQSSYAAIQEEVSRFESILRSKHLNSLKKDVMDLEELYELNLQFYRELSIFIMAGRLRLEQAKKYELPQSNQEARESGSALLLQKASELDTSIKNFEAKLYSLELSRQQCIYTAASIRQLQGTYRSLVEQILQLILTTIPTWRLEMRINLGIKDKDEVRTAIDMARNFTEQTILAGVEQLSKIVESTKEDAKSTISVDKAIKANELFISTIERQIEINRQYIQEIEEGSLVLEDKRKAALDSFTQDSIEDIPEHTLPSSSDDKEDKKIYRLES